MEPFHQGRHAAAKGDQRRWAPALSHAPLIRRSMPHQRGLPFCSNRS